MMRSRYSWIVLVVLAMVLAGCGAARMTPPSQAPMAPAASGGAADAVTSLPAALETGPGAVGGANGRMDPKQGVPGAERLVIKQAILELVVSDVRLAEAAVQNLAATLGGYVVNVSTSGSDDSLRSTITIRVPAERFDQALQSAEGLAQQVETRQVSGDDVTEEFVDLESQLRNLEATRDRLLSFLEKANKVEEALQVNQALSDVQGQIELVRGRMQYLQRSAALSTITVSLRPVVVTPIIAEDGWRADEVFRQALRGLVEFGQGVLSLLIVLGVWIPVWGPLLLVGAWGLRRLVRRPARPQPVTAMPPQGQ